MRTSLSMLMTLVLLLGNIPRAYAQETGEQTAREIIEKAVQVHGGKENLAKYLAVSVRGKGTLFLADGRSIPAEISFWSQWPDQTKLVTRLTVQDGQVLGVRILNGEQGWEQVDGNTRKVNDTELKGMQQAVYESHVLLFYPLLEDPRFTLQLLEDVKVAGRLAAGVRVVSKGRADLSLYFDKGTGLLMKTSGPTIDPAEGKVLEQFYSNYKDFGGRKFPVKQFILLDGKKHLDSEVLELRPLEKIDPATFAKPQ